MANFRHQEKLPIFLLHCLQVHNGVKIISKLLCSFIFIFYKLFEKFSCYEWIKTEELPRSKTNARSEIVSPRCVYKCLHIVFTKLQYILMRNGLKFFVTEHSYCHSLAFIWRFFCNLYEITFLARECESLNLLFFILSSRKFHKH